MAESRADVPQLRNGDDGIQKCERNGKGEMSALRRGIGEPHGGAQARTLRYVSAGREQGEINEKRIDRQRRNASRLKQSRRVNRVSGHGENGTESNAAKALKPPTESIRYFPSGAFVFSGSLRLCRTAECRTAEAQSFGGKTRAGTIIGGLRRAALSTRRRKM